MPLVKNSSVEQSLYTGNPKVNSEVNSVLAQQVPEQPKSPALSLEEQIQRVKDLAILVEKQGQLQASLQEIFTFKLSADSISNRVSLRNVVTQREFNTSKSEDILTANDTLVLGCPKLNCFGLSKEV